MTLVELLVTMVILGIVLVGITGSFLSGLKAETGVEKRQQAQSEARMALSRMRDDIHCAFEVQNLALNPSGGYTLSLTEFSNQCATVASQPGSGSTVFVAWCTVPDPLHAGTFDLYRATGACDNTGTLMAADIVSPADGWPSNQPGRVWPVSRTCVTGYLKTQAVHLSVDTDSSAPSERYELKDEIALRNSTRSVGCTGPGAPAQLLFTTQPSDVAAGAAFPTSPVVTAEDGAGNIITNYSGTVALSIKSGTGTVGASLTGCSAVNVNGATTFSGCKIDKPGNGYVLVGADGAYSVESSPFNVTAGPAATFVVAGYPSPTVSGVSHTFTVTAKDSAGNTATGYGGTVHFTSSDGAANLPANYTFTAGDSGTHTFNATLKTIGTQSITATDTVTGTITGSQTGINVTAGPAATLVVAGYPSPTTAGVPRTFTVTAKDANGNTATGYTGTVRFTSDDGAASLPGNYTFVAGDNGAHTFTATLKTAGTRSLTATDTGTASITGSQTGINVTAGPATTLVVVGYPSPTTAGVSQTFTVTAKDAYGNTATGYTGTVGFSSSDGAATLPANYKFVAGDNGSRSFSATLKTAGTRSITATDTGTASITGSQTGITVNAGPAATLLVAGYPSPTTAGVSGTFTVTAKDANGNTATGYTGTVRLSSSDPAATLPGNYTFVAGDNGAHSFTATLKTTGTRSITATDTGTASITGSQTGITVNAGPAATLVVAGYPSPTTAGVPHTFTVTAQDAYGNTATGYTGTVGFSSSDPAASLSANYKFVAGDNGTRSFTATLKTAGTRSLTATDTGTGSITGSQTGITVTAGPAATFDVAGYPSPTTAGVPHTFTVTAQDANGNTVTGYTGTVRFSSSDGAAGLPANYTFLAGDNGSRSFTATLKTAGSQSITATDTGTGSITGSQTGITVNAAAATALAFVNCSTPGGNTTCTGPISLGNNGSMTFKVQTTDPFGNASAPTAAVTILIGTGGNANLTISSGSPATITPPASVTGLITLSHNKTASTATVRAQVTSGPAFADITMNVTGT